MIKLAEQLLNENQRRTRSVRNKATGNRKYKIIQETPKDYIVLDFETTGPRPGADQIIQISAIKYLNNKETELFQTLINPRRYISHEVAKQTKVSNFIVEDAPYIEDKIVQLLDFINQLPVVTHNASIHMNFLYAIEHIEGVRIPALQVIDTARLARKSITKFSEPKLIKLTEYLQQECGDQDTVNNCYTINNIYQLCIQHV